MVLEIVLQEVQARDAAQYNARTQRQDKGVEVDILAQHVADNDVRRVTCVFECVNSA